MISSTESLQYSRQLGEIRMFIDVLQSGWHFPIHQCVEYVVG